jgi:hypothetical protein
LIAPIIAGPGGKRQELLSPHGQGGEQISLASPASVKCPYIFEKGAISEGQVAAKQPLFTAHGQYGLDFDKNHGFRRQE